MNTVTVIKDIIEDKTQPERPLVNFFAEIIKYLDANNIDVDVNYCMRFASDMVNDYKEDKEEYQDSLKDYLI